MDPIVISGFNKYPTELGWENDLWRISKPYDNYFEDVFLKIGRNMQRSDSFLGRELRQWSR